MSQKTFANHLADEEAAIAQQAQNPHSSTTSGHRPTAAAPKEMSLTMTESRSPSETPTDELLLKSYVPEAPSPEVMDALVSAPPLLYHLARATLPENPKPRRHFCEICGYWGTIKCLKCGARVCGLECKGTHDEGRCLKFYA